MSTKLLKHHPFMGSCIFLLCASLIISSCNASSVQTRQPLQETALNECVILIHGLGRTHRSMIPGENDGKVSVTRTKLDGMSDFLVVPESHTYIMYSDLVQNETIHFLKHGVFSDADD